MRWLVEKEEIACVPTSPWDVVDPTRELYRLASLLAGRMGKEVVEHRRFPKARAFFAKIAKKEATSP